MIFNLGIKISTAWNIVKFRLKGIKYGSKLRVSGHIGIKNNGSCVIGDHFICISGTMRNPMGRNVRSCLYIGPHAKLSIGNQVGISSVCIWCSKSIKIGNHVKIGALAVITDTDAHSIDYITRRTWPKDEQLACKKDIEIEDDVFIGYGAIICKGVTIGARSIVGAGSVVTKSIPSDQLWAGNPAKYIKSLK